jgi:hypothetical protein
MNKKAMSPAETLGVFILVFLLVFGLIVLYTKVVNGSTKVLQCTANGGECRVGTCDFASQLPALSDKAAGCQKGEICCINITQGITEDPLCKDHKDGEACGTDNLHFCSVGGKQCVTKCEFCSINPTHENCKDKASLNLFKTGTYAYSCKCTEDQCVGKIDIKGGSECIRNYCPGNEVCCNILTTK